MYLFPTWPAVAVVFFISRVPPGGKYSAWQRRLLGLWSPLAALSATTIVVGTLAYSVQCNRPHLQPDPDNPTEMCLQLVAGYPAWVMMSTVIIVTFACGFVFKCSWRAVCVVGVVSPVCVVLFMAPYVETGELLYAALIVVIVCILIVLVTYSTERTDREVYDLLQSRTEQLTALLKAQKEAAEKQQELDVERDRRIVEAAERAASRRIVGYACHELRNPLHASTLCVMCDV